MAKKKKTSGTKDKATKKATKKTKKVVRKKVVKKKVAKKKSPTKSPTKSLAKKASELAEALVPKENQAPEWNADAKTSSFPIVCKHRSNTAARPSQKVQRSGLKVSILAGVWID